MISPKVLVLLSVFAISVRAQFNPTLEVTSCTQSKLTLSVTDAVANGIIYIQGQGAACKQTTSTGTVTHEFDFTSCGIQWESSFKIIIQKKSLYQTGDDKQIPIMCITDLSDLTVSAGINALDKDDDAGKNLTVKPTASMKIYADGNDVTGTSVKLTDVLTMNLALDNDYLADFDILATACTASTISIVENSCATDIELFPDFSKPAQGYLISSFGAFRTTELSGGSVSMTFSCTLQVCLGSCSPATCSNGNSGYGRKKRSLVKRQAPGGDDGQIEEINVGATLKISTESVVLNTPDDDEDVCIDKAAFVVGMMATAAAVVTSAVAAAVMAKKNQMNASALKKLDAGLTSVSMS